MTPARITSGSHDGELRIWDLESGQTAGVLGPHTHAMGFDSLAATPDDCRVITGLSDGTLRVWDLGTGQDVSVLTGHTALVDSIALTPSDAVRELRKNGVGQNLAQRLRLNLP
jgi:WD40 repeat protein